jgi:hypothetical protein
VGKQIVKDNEEFSSKIGSTSSQTGIDKLTPYVCEDPRQTTSARQLPSPKTQSALSKESTAISGTDHVFEECLGNLAPWAIFVN